MLVSVLRRRARRLSKRIPLSKVVLFGSYAQQRQTASSDVDVLIVYHGPKLKNDYSVVWDTLAVDQLQPHIYTFSEYQKIKSMVNPFLVEVERTGITVYEAKS